MNGICRIVFGILVACSFLRGVYASETFLEPKASPCKELMASPRPELSPSAITFASLVEIGISQNDSQHSALMANLRMAADSENPVNPFTNLKSTLFVALSNRSEGLIDSIKLDWPHLRQKILIILDGSKGKESGRQVDIAQTRRIRVTKKYKNDPPGRGSQTFFRTVGQIEGSFENIVEEIEQPKFGESDYRVRLRATNFEESRVVFKMPSTHYRRYPDMVYFEGGLFTTVGSELVRIDMKDGRIQKLGVHDGQLFVLQGKRLMMFYRIGDVKEYWNSTFVNVLGFGSYSHPDPSRRYRSWVPINFGMATGIWFEKPSKWEEKVDFSWFDGNTYPSKAPTKFNNSRFLLNLFSVPDEKSDWKLDNPVAVPMWGSELLLVLSKMHHAGQSPRSAGIFDPTTLKAWRLNVNPSDIPANVFIYELVFSSTGRLQLRTLDTDAKLLTTWQLDGRHGEFADPIKTDVSFLSEYFHLSSNFLATGLGRGMLVFDQHGRRPIGLNAPDGTVSILDTELQRDGGDR